MEVGKLEFTEEIKSKIALYLRMKQPTKLLEQIEFYHKSYEYLSNILSKTNMHNKTKKDILENSVYTNIKSDLEEFIHIHRGLNIRYSELKKRNQNMAEKYIIYDILSQNYFQDTKKMVKFICGYLKDRAIVNIIQRVKADIDAFHIFKANGLL